MQIGNSETEESWSQLFAWLKGRGLNGVDVVVSDNHGGLVKAIQAQFQGATWQRCQTHFTRNILDACPKRLQKELHSKLRLIFEAVDKTTARNLLASITEEYYESAPKAISTLEEGFDDSIAVLMFPENTGNVCGQQTALNG